MTILSKILVGFVMLAGIIFFYFAARTLKTHQSFRERFESYNSKVENEKKRQHQFKEGGADPKVDLGLRQAKAELNRLLTLRGHVWTQCLPSVPAPDRRIAVTIGKPKPHRIVPPTGPDKAPVLVHVFEEKSAKDGGKYIGEFRVIQASQNPEENSIVIIPVLPTKVEDYELRKDEIAAFDKLLAESTDPARGNTWVLHDVMPVDSHEAFAGLQPDQYEGLIPESSRDSYQRDGSEAKADDPEANKVTDDKGNVIFQRTLHDYGVLFREYQRLYTGFRDQLDGIRRDNAFVKTAIEDQETAEIAFIDKQIEEAKMQLARAEAEKKAADDHLAAVETELKRLQDGVKTALESIQKDSDELAKIQLKAVEDADKRTKAASTSAVIDP